jgi:toxin-antitoxin system PIN domain toxin
MTCLPDVNVWIALIVAEHVGHRTAVEWYGGPDWDTLVFSRVTQMGFLRLLTNQHVMGKRVVDAGGAWAILDRVRQGPNIAFAREPAGVEDVWRNLTANRSVGHNFWTDSYLAGFAEASGFTLVTFDQGFKQYKNTPLKILSRPS